MDDIILDMSEVDEQFINEIKALIQHEIKISLECAFESKSHDNVFIRRSKLKQFALKLINEYK